MTRRITLNTTGQNPNWEYAKSEVLYLYWICAQEHIRDLAYKRFGDDWPKHVGRITPLGVLDNALTDDG